MSVTTLPSRGALHRQPGAGAAVRLQAVPDCRLPDTGDRSFAVFLTYPLGLASGSLSPTPPSAAAHFVGWRISVSADDPVVERVFYSVFYTRLPPSENSRSLLAGCSEQPLSVQEPLRAIVLLPWIVPTVLSRWRSGGSTIRNSRSFCICWSTCCTSAPPISTFSVVLPARSRDRRQYLGGIPFVAIRCCRCRPSRPRSTSGDAGRRHRLQRFRYITFR